MLPVSEEDKEALKDVVDRMGVEMPDLKISIYKNRRGKYKGVLLWCKARLGICRIDPMFATDYALSLIPIEDTKIHITPDNITSAF